MPRFIIAMRLQEVTFHLSRKQWCEGQDHELVLPDFDAEHWSLCAVHDCLSNCNYDRS